MIQLWKIGEKSGKKLGFLFVIYIQHIGSPRGIYITIKIDF